MPSNLETLLKLVRETTEVFAPELTEELARLIRAYWPATPAVQPMSSNLEACVDALQFNAESPDTIDLERAIEIVTARWPAAPAVQPSEATELTDSLIEAEDTNAILEKIPKIIFAIRRLSAENQQLEKALNDVGDFSYQKLADAVAEIERLKAEWTALVERVGELMATWGDVPGGNGNSTTQSCATKLRSILAEAKP